MVVNDYASLADEPARKILSFTAYLQRVLRAEAPRGGRSR